MNEQQTKSRKGLTLIELMITVLAVMVFVFGITGILAAGHTNYNTMQRRITRGVVPESYEVRSTFDRIVRKSVQAYDISDDKNELTVYYYAGDAVTNLSAPPNRYARFFLSGDKLMLERGSVGNSESPTTVQLTAIYDDEKDVKVVPPEEGIFSVDGSAVKMVLILGSKRIH